MRPILAHIGIYLVDILGYPHVDEGLEEASCRLLRLGPHEEMHFEHLIGEVANFLRQQWQGGI